MTLNLIEALKVTIYETKHSTNAKIVFQRSNFKKHQIQKSKHSFESACSAHLYGQAGNYLFNCFRCFFLKLLSDITLF